MAASEIRRAIVGNIPDCLRNCVNKEYFMRSSSGGMINSLNNNITASIFNSSSSSSSNNMGASTASGANLPVAAAVAQLMEGKVTDFSAIKQRLR